MERGYSSFVSFAACMLSSSCSARARLSAFVCTSSKKPSSFRKSSSLELVCTLRFATLPLLEAFQRQLNVRIGRVLRFLDEPMKQYHPPTFDREERSCDSIVQRRPNLLAYRGPSNRKTILRTPCGSCFSRCSVPTSPVCDKRCLERVMFGSPEFSRTTHHVPWALHFMLFRVS